MVNLATMLAPDPTIPARHPSNGGRLTTVDGRTLPLKHARVTAEATGGIARVVLQQTFINPHRDRLAVRYLLPLPSDGAVSGFSFRIGNRLITGEVDRRARARERFEQALVSGKTAALLEEDRDSLFTQEIGNIPPQSEIVAEIIIDQPLIWLYEGAWEWRFPTVVGPRYMGQEGRVADAKKLTVDVANAPISARIELALTIGDTLTPGRRPESPSHLLDIAASSRRTRVVLQAQEGARLDRDIVVRWPVVKPDVGVSIAAGRPAAVEHGGKKYALVTLVPPAPETNAPALARDLIFLIDTSGSMGGRPLEQAKRVVSLMIESLEDDDRLELIEFGSRPRRWQKEPVVMTREGKKQALKWVKELESSGGTEMRAAVLEALRPLRSDAQRQIVLVTDGYVGFEREIVREVHDRLPRGSRLHALGVGSAVNRSLTRAAARAGAGLEVVLGLDEDPERGAVRMIARTARPMVTELQLDCDGLIDVVPRRLPDLFAGAPVKIAVALMEGATELRVRGKTAEGVWEDGANVALLPLGGGQQAVAALFAREAVEDCEAHLAGGGDPAEIDRVIEQLGLEFQIATRLTSWVAITEERSVDPGAQLLRETMPHELPYGTSMEGLGLRAASAPEAGAASRMRAGSGMADMMPRLAKKMAAAPVSASSDDDALTLFGGEDADQMAPRDELDLGLDEMLSIPMERAPSPASLPPPAAKRRPSPAKKAEPELRSLSMPRRITESKPAATPEPERAMPRAGSASAPAPKTPEKIEMPSAHLSLSDEDPNTRMSKRGNEMSPIAMAIFGAIVVAIILAILAIIWWGR
jgi:Ca-activated chloride channel homolog